MQAKTLGSQSLKRIKKQLLWVLKQQLTFGQTTSRIVFTPGLFFDIQNIGISISDCTQKMFPS